MRKKAAQKCSFFFVLNYQFFLLSVCLIQKLFCEFYREFSNIKISERNNLFIFDENSN